MRRRHLALLVLGALLLAPSAVAVPGDPTPPVITVATHGTLGANGWYVSNVTVIWTVSEPEGPPLSTTGCDARTITADTTGVTVTCSATSDGGTTSTSRTVRIDRVPPTISSLRAKPGRRFADLAWKVSDETKRVEVIRSPGIRGAPQSVVYQGLSARHRDRGLTPGRKYRYTVAAYDEAANRSAREAIFVGRGALLDPAPGALVTSAPLLLWSRVSRATYYNVVLVRARRRVFSAWPVRPRLQLPRRWVYRGQHYRLRPGVYRWYVWPGFGSLSAGRYGGLLGGSTFVVDR
jgi:hypothetical protein